MNQIGNTPAAAGLNPFHQTANPTNSATTQTGQGGPAITPITFGAFVGVPVYPVALIPAFMMAQPQFSGGAAFSGAGAGAGPVADGADGAHVTANPTNSLQTQAGGGQFGAYPGVNAGFGVSGGMSIMMSPVLMALGFPVLGFYGGQPAGNAAANDGNETPVDDGVVTPPVLDGPEGNLGSDIDTSAPPPVTAPDAPPVIDVPPPTNDQPTLPTLPIAEVTAVDFAKYRLLETERKTESSLTLELTTQDGDLISLDFSQMDLESSSKFRGKTLEGERITDFSMTEDSQRVVNMEVVGTLSSEEQAAIDSVLSSVIDVVQNFFSGDMDAAINKLNMMDFNTSELSELSLNMSLSQSAEVSRAYHNGADRLHDLKARDADIGHALEFLANEQRRLVDVASSVLEAPSAAKLIRTLLPPLLSEPFSELQLQLDQAAEPSSSAVVETDVAQSDQTKASEPQADAAKVIANS